MAVLRDKRGRWCADWRDPTRHRHRRVCHTYAEASALHQHYAQRRALCQRARLRPFRLHDLRHTLATALVRRGTPLPTLQAILGHRYPWSLHHYVHAAGLGLIEALRALHEENQHPQQKENR